MKLIQYFVLIFLCVYSFDSYSGTINLATPITGGGEVLLPAGPCGASVSACKSAAVKQYYSGCSASSNPCPYNLTNAYFSGDKLFLLYTTWGPRTAYLNSAYSQIDDGNECSTKQECFFVANQACESQGLLLSDYQFISAGNYTHACADGPPDPSEECEQTIAEYCANNFGLGSSNFTDNGDGSSSCTGTCLDGTPAAAPEPKEECNLANNYCDVADTPSDLDFGSGNTGSDGGSSSNTTTDKDPENDIDYEPDGSGSSASENGGMSALQGDKLINEVVKSRNDNTDNLASTTDTTNQTIVEKSDDIQNTISNSANGIIDAVNNATPFYDGNIVDAINGLDTGGDGFDDSGIIDAIDGLGDKLNESSYESQGFNGHADEWGQSMFGVVKIESLQSKIVDLQTAIDSENLSFKGTLNAYVNFSSQANGYQANSLDLGKWGSHDISLARFADFFGGIANIVYFLASITALTIVLGGVKS